MWHAWERGQVFMRFWLGGLKGRDHWEDNIMMDLREIGIDGVNCIQLAQDRVQWQASVSRTFGFHKESWLLFDKLSDYQLFKEHPAPWSKSHQIGGSNPTSGMNVCLYAVLVKTEASDWSFIG